MTQTDVIKQWLKIAENDFDAGKDLFNTKKYLLSIYFCHQALEKYLKAYILKVLKKTPPPIHDLTRLSKNAKLDSLDFKYSTLLEELNPFYIKSRYPNYKQKVFSIANKTYTKNIIIETEDCILWIKNKMK